MYLFIISNSLFGYLGANIGFIPQAIRWIPDLLSIFIILLIPIIFIVKKEFNCYPKYIILVFLFAATILLGIILNTNSAESIIIGFRTYLKHLPLFFLPAVYNIVDRDLKKQLVLLLSMLLIQLPITIYQRFYQYAGKLSGDDIRGTCPDSGSLSLILICGIAVLFGYYLKKQLSLSAFVFITSCLIFPTMINETKVTLIALPLALITVVLVIKSDTGGINIKKYVTLAMIVILSFAIFIPVYDYFMKPRLGFGIVEFIKDRQKLTQYLYKGAEGRVNEELRRGDSLALTYRALKRDIGSLIFGLGIGNVVDTSFRFLNHKPLDIYNYKSDQIFITQMLWELGILGTLLYVILFPILFKDSLALVSIEGIVGVFAIGWCGVIVVICLSIVYLNILQINILNFLFWYFAGVVSAKRYRVEQKNQYGAISDLE